VTGIENDMTPNDLELKAAVHQGDVARAAAAINRLGRVKGIHGERLVWAAREGDAEMATLLLDNGADVHAMDEGALIAASSAGHADIVTMLIERGANLHTGADGPLHLAVREGHLDTVAALLAKGADVHAMGDRALLAAVTQDFADITVLLLDHGAKIEAKNPAGHTPLAAAVLASSLLVGHAGMVDLLLCRGADPTADNAAPLRFAAASGNAEVVSLLFRHGHFSDQQISVARLCTDMKPNAAPARAVIDAFLQSRALERTRVGTPGPGVGLGHPVNTADNTANNTATAPSPARGSRL